MTFEAGILALGLAHSCPITVAAQRRTFTGFRHYALASGLRVTSKQPVVNVPQAG